MNTMLRRIPDHISLESIRATWAVGLYLYRMPLPVQPDAQIACWYGEKEGYMKKRYRSCGQYIPSCLSDAFPASDMETSSTIQRCLYQN